jgi:pyridoxamine 5'-phosphate oxidase
MNGHGRSISSIRTDYARASLSESDVLPDPVSMVRRWLDEAVHAEVSEPTAMALATATSQGIPSVRMVLLKGIDEAGFIFFTNMESRKGKELQQNPSAAVSFFWAELERQIRIEGRIEQIDPAESDRYFSERPRESQLGAIASRQSDVLADRTQLVEAVEKLRAEYENRPIARPMNWGGYRLIPTVFEFWQGRSNRLHDRIRYTNHSSQWRIERLFP